MKPFNTLTNEELCNITEEQLTTYVDYAMAEAGHPIELEELERPESISVEPDLEYISLDFRDILLDVDAGRQIQDIIQNSVVRKKSYNGVIQIVKPDGYEYPEFKIARLESDELKAKKAAANKLLTLEWEDYNKRQELNSDALSYRQEILDDLYKQISSARSEAYDKKTKMDAWDKYLSLANNDRTIAKNFFVERYSVSEYDELFED